ncbi:MAG: electron transfer flavoprotein subunit beta/FixA family protein [Bdellovibrionales bacterium]|nr:electron transfer flavoprotein subunit beta/FixA family protein [Bdellovibrionales bacterium]
MNIFVCIKQVPDTETKIKLSGSGIDTAGIKWVMNPYDEFAVEEALKFKAQNSSAQIYAITAGPKARVVEVLRTALAMGTDEAVVVDAPENLDSFSAAKLLAKAIQSVGPAHLVYTGKLAIDDNQASTSQIIAEFLGLPHVTVVSKIEYQGTSVTVEREIEGGTKEILQVNGPVVLAANKGLNTPRYPSLPGIMKAKKKAIKELDSAAMGLEGSDKKISYTQYALPKDRPEAKLLAGDVKTQASMLAKLLREEAKVI